ncbi:alpha/beta fold hydrolase [Vibrio metoecus]|uniref:Alpha/beta hydrolase n=1 Tax=Vibrio metoecus TaxID=1481663 RepID=A0A271VXK4_VIBMT|nr:alpha/beta hydrolase [Vibrio metoecus]KQB09202.1 hydrolase [Vibrio metoecus]PAR22707.1 alpha/beta hydrolase [Vibrio metoecus]PAR26222.1 alpha/beta hydrolase [Vibrio metoecus]
MKLIETTYSLELGQLAAVEVGDAKMAEVSVIFIHGWLDNAASFFSLMQALHALAPELHLCAIDLLGHGLSSHRAGYYPFHDYIDDIDQLLLNLSPNKHVLVGHSLGALIASCYSAAFPEQVNGFVQIEGFGPLSEPATESVTRLRQGVRSRHALRNVKPRGYSSFDHALRHRALVNQLSGELLRPLVERGTYQHDEQWFWRHDLKLKADSLYRMTPEHAAQGRESIRCPQQVILGSQGFATLKQQAQNPEFATIPIATVTGGHHCHLEQPQAVAELIFGLVNKI